MPSPQPNKIKTVYFAGSLFDLQEIVGNEALANRIQEQSQGRYQFVLPQRLGQNYGQVKLIRDQDIVSINSVDGILVMANGTDLDSGTVVEYMISKMLDKPAVFLRTDYRESVCLSNQEKLPFNPMVTNYPRTETVLIDGLTVYKNLGNSSDQLLQETARQVVIALDRVFLTPPIIDVDLSATSKLLGIEELTHTTPVSFFFLSADV